MSEDNRFEKQSREDRDETKRIERGKSRATDQAPENPKETKRIEELKRKQGS
jgi:hypothetical protein